MLNLNDIAKRIEQPELSSGGDIDALQSFTEKYPYSQLFSILYLKALKNAGNVHFDDELKKHSFRITDRVQLFHLIQDQPAVHEENSIEIQGESIEKLENEVVPKSELIENKQTDFDVIQTELLNEDSTSIDDKEIETSSPEEVVSELSSDFSEKITIDSHKSTSEDEINYDIETEEVKNHPIDEKLDKLEETILHHALAANYQLDELTPEEERRLAENNKEFASNEEKIIEEESLKETESISSAKTEEVHSFNSWLHLNKNYAAPEINETEEIKAIVSAFADFDPTSALFGEVEKPKKPFFSATKKAKESLDEVELPVSETLAKIYEMQGNYPKAITAYEQLSLINPEKRTFFASLIEKLTKKLNSE